MTAQPDEVVGVLALLAADSAVTALAGSRIYGGGLPGSQSSQMPPLSLTVRAAGGRPAPASPGLRNPRVDIRAYGPTEAQAKALALAAAGALTWRSPVTAGGIRFYKVEPEADILTGVEPDTAWPFAWQSFITTVNR